MADSDRILHGIDVSKHQGDIDWARVASHQPPLRFVMSRMSHGGHGNHDLRTDPKAAQNRAGMRSSFPNAHRGLYHFLGSSDPQVQVQRFKSVVVGLEPGEFVALDVEPDADAGVGVLAVSHIVATLEAIEQTFGRTPWLYIGHPYPGVFDQRLHRFPLHFPVYEPLTTMRRLEADMGRSAMVWQWGGGKEGALVEGIPKPAGSTGRVDSNRIMDEAQFLASVGPGGGSGLGTRTAGAGDTRSLQFMPELREGAHENAVFILQCLLIQHGVTHDVDVNRDGKFETGTTGAVTRFQTQRGLPQSGRVDRPTWGAFGTTAQAPGALQFMPQLREGAHGNAVFVLQCLLIQHGVTHDVDVNRDGKFETGTTGAVTRFQTQRGLPQSGRVDGETWNALGRT